MPSAAPPTDAGKEDPTDAGLLEALGDGGRTAAVADRLGMLNRRPYVLRRLKKLERAGKVSSRNRETYPAELFWERVA